MKNYIKPDLQKFDMQVQAHILDGSTQSNETFNQTEWQYQNDWI